MRNQDESDADCGGSICGGCVIGQNCTADSDCLGNKCTEGKCGTCNYYCHVIALYLPILDESCSDGIINQDETDVDCGGVICVGCAFNKICVVNGDCISIKCTNLQCGKSRSINTFSISKHF